MIIFLCCSVTYIILTINTSRVMRQQAFPYCLIQTILKRKDKRAKRNKQGNAKCKKKEEREWTTKVVNANHLPYRTESRACCLKVSLMPLSHLVHLLHNLKIPPVLLDMVFLFSFFLSFCSYVWTLLPDLIFFFLLFQWH